jgi:integrase
MPRALTGSVYREARGTYGIRWTERGKRPQKGGFRTKTDARDYLNEQVKPRLRRGAPSGDITLEAFCGLYLERWEAAPKTVQGFNERIRPAVERFGSYSLQELEGAAHDIAAWRAGRPTPNQRYVNTRALRQLLAAAVRWQYMLRNPAVDAGPNPQPRGEEVHPFSNDEIARIVDEMRPTDAAIVVFACETGLRTNEWLALERRDVDRQNPAVAVARRFSNGRLTPYPKTARRRVPLTPRAEEALSWLPASLSTPLLFPAALGGHMNLNNWRKRIWEPSIRSADVCLRGPYTCRHTFASNALAKKVSVFELSRLMGCSVQMIQQHYGHMLRDSEDHMRDLLAGTG